MRLLALIAALVAAAVVVVFLVAPGGSPETASAQLPLQEITSPPPEHHADPALKP